MRTAITAALVLAAGLWALSGCGRKARRTADKDRAEILSLEKELDGLRARAETLSVGASWAPGLPEAPLIIGLPTALAPTSSGGSPPVRGPPTSGSRTSSSGRTAGSRNTYPRRLQPADHRQPVTARLNTGAPRSPRAIRWPSACPVRSRFRHWPATDHFSGTPMNITGPSAAIGHHQEVTGRPARPYSVAGLKLTARRQICGAGLSAAPDQSSGWSVRESWRPRGKSSTTKTGLRVRLDALSHGTVRRRATRASRCACRREIKPVALPVGTSILIFRRAAKSGHGHPVTGLASRPDDLARRRTAGSPALWDCNAGPGRRTAGPTDPPGNHQRDRCLSKKGPVRGRGKTIPRTGRRRAPASETRARSRTEERTSETEPDASGRAFGLRAKVLPC